LIRFGEEVDELLWRGINKSDDLTEISDFAGFLMKQSSIVGLEENLDEDIDKALRGIGEQVIVRCQSVGGMRIAEIDLITWAKFAKNYIDQSMIGKHTEIGLKSEKIANILWLWGTPIKVSD